MVEAEVAKRVKEKLSRLQKMSPEDCLDFVLELELTDEQFDRLHNYSQTFHDATCSVATLKRKRVKSKKEVVELFNITTDNGTMKVNVSRLMIWAGQKWEMKERAKFKIVIDKVFSPSFFKCSSFI